MAELDVQPKSGRPWWLWLLLALIALALIFFLMRGCDNRDTTTEGAATETTTDADETAMTTSDDDWNNLNFDVPAATYEEISDADIKVRGNEEYTIYSVDETVLFDTDKATIKPAASNKLEQIAASVGKRYNRGQIRIFGYTDAKGSAGYNQQLAEQRAAAVQTWLVNNGKMAPENISLHAVGEANPVASNATAQGRAQNRRVEIVARQAD